MRIRATICGLAAIALLATPVSAQEEEAPKPAFSVITIEQTPATMLEWRSAVNRLATAVKANGLSASDYGWWTYHSEHQTRIIWPVPQDELFHQNKVFEAIAEADSAEAAAIGELFRSAPSRNLSTEIIEWDQELSYAPATPLEGPPGGANVFDVTIAENMEEEFVAGIKEYVRFLGELGSPYAMNAYRVRYGQHRVQLVTFWDDEASFVGENSFGSLMEKHPEMGEEVQAGYANFLKSVSSMESLTIYYDEDGSVPPVPAN